MIDALLIHGRANVMNLKYAFIGMLAAGCLVAGSMLWPNAARAQDSEAKVKTAMASLKAKAQKLGPAKIEDRPCDLLWRHQDQ
jgi:hypothetical protein